MTASNTYGTKDLFWLNLDQNLSIERREEGVVRLYQERYSSGAFVDMTKTEACLLLTHLESNKNSPRVKVSKTGGVFRLLEWDSDGTDDTTIVLYLKEATVCLRWLKDWYHDMIKNKGWKKSNQAPKQN